MQGSRLGATRTWRLTESVALAELGPISTLYAPIAPPPLPPPPRARWDPRSMYETSALDAAVLDAATTVWRLGRRAVGASDMRAISQLLVLPSHLPHTSS